MTTKNTIAKTLLLATMAFASFSCEKYDDFALRQDFTNLEDRVTNLENWQKQVNTDLTYLQTLVSALESKNFITSIVPVTGGYTIKFQNGSDVTLLNGVNGTDGKDGVDGTNGKDGASPKIGFKTDGGVNYWTLDGEFILDDQGAKLPVTGSDGADGIDGATGAAGADAVVPQLRINSDTDEWEISTDAGETWTSTGVKATGSDGSDVNDGTTGDSVFKSVDATSPDQVTFTLTDGTTFSLPIFKEVSVSFALDSANPIDVIPGNGILEVGVDINGLEEDDVKVIMAEMRLKDYSFYSIYARATTPRIITVEPSTFSGKTGAAKISISQDLLMGAPSEIAMLLVTIVDKSGKEYVAVQMLKIWASEFDYLLTQSDDDFSFTAMDDFYITSPLVVKKDRSITINLNGNEFMLKNIVLEEGASLTIDGGEPDDCGKVVLVDSDTDYGIHLMGKGGSLTIKDALINSNNALAAICVGDEHNPESIDNVVKIENSSILRQDCSAIILINKQNLTVESSNLYSDAYGILQNGETCGSTIVLNDCTMSVNKTGIYLSNTVSGLANKLSVTGCDITSEEASAIEVKKTNLTINGNTALCSNAHTQSYTLNVNDAGSIGYGVVLAGYALGTVYEGTIGIDSSTEYYLSAGFDAIKALIYIGQADGHGHDFYSVE